MNKQTKLRKFIISYLAVKYVLQEVLQMKGVWHRYLALQKGMKNSRNCYKNVFPRKSKITYVACAAFQLLSVCLGTGRKA